MAISHNGNQIFGALAVNAFLTAYGLLEGYTVPALPQLRRHDSGLSVTDEGASWIGAILLLGIAAGTPLQTFTLAFGRRRVLMLASPILCLGALLMTFPVSVEMLLAGRLLCGLVIGSIQPMPHIFISETADPQWRGGLIASGMFLTNIGLIIVYCLGFFLTWRQIGATIATYYALYPLMLWKLPETPNWLVTHGREEEARRSLAFYKGEAADAAEELERIRQRSTVHNPDRPPISELKKRAFFMPLIVSISVTVTKAASGTPAIHLYSYDMFVAVGGNADPLVASVISTSLSSVGSVIAIALMDRAGRRGLFLTTVIVCGGSWVTIGLAAWLVEDPVTTDWVSIIGFSLALFVYNVGIGPVSLVIMGEMIPIRYRTVISPAQTMIMWTSSFAVGKTFFQLRDALTFPGLCFLYAGICLLFVITGFFLMPETKGKTLSDIEELFENRGPAGSRKTSVDYRDLQGETDTIGGVESQEAASVPLNSGLPSSYGTGPTGAHLT